MFFRGVFFSKQRNLCLIRTTTNAVLLGSFVQLSTVSRFFFREVTEKIMREEVTVSDGDYLAINCTLEPRNGFWRGQTVGKVSNAMN